MGMLTCRPCQSCMPQLDQGVSHSRQPLRAQSAGYAAPSVQSLPVCHASLNPTPYTLNLQPTAGCLSLCQPPSFNGSCERHVSGKVPCGRASSHSLRSMPQWDHARSCRWQASRGRIRWLCHPLSAAGKLNHSSLGLRVPATFLPLHLAGGPCAMASVYPPVRFQALGFGAQALKLVSVDKSFEKQCIRQISLQLV